MPEQTKPGSVLVVRKDSGVVGTPKKGFLATSNAQCLLCKKVPYVKNGSASH
jgi:hypothetical protein